MTCRCRSQEEHAAREAEGLRRRVRDADERSRKRVAELEQEIASGVADPTKFDILDAVPVGSYFVVRVQFPSCTKCEFEGIKILVYQDVTAVDALKWKRLDPHFQDDGKRKRTPQDAPSPVARFPANERGWKDALHYAQSRLNRL